MDDHVSRILKMLEEGKITAEQAETLISALKTAESKPSASASPRPAESKTSDSQPVDGEGSRAKSFEFRWSQKRAFPALDLSGLGKQITDAVKKLDPLMKEARTGFQKGGKRWNERFRGWGWFAEGEDGRPENTLGQPTARATESVSFDLGENGQAHVENNHGSIAVFGGGDKVLLEYDSEAWGPTEEEAKAKLAELNVESQLLSPEGATPRLEVRAVAPESFRDGVVHLRLHIPGGPSAKLGAIFGDVRVENTAGSVEVHAISGTVSLENLKGDVDAEGISGEMSAKTIAGALRMTSKSGDLRAQSLSRGGTVIAVSGDVNISAVEGGRLEAKSVSGDVLVQTAGQQSPVDITVESVSGDVTLFEARGNITLKTVSGDVSAEKLDALTLQGQTVSGDVKVALSAPFAGTLTTNTVSGDVKIKAPIDSNFRFTLATQSGELECEHDAKDSSRSDTLWTGTVGTGAGMVNIQTRSGDVSLEVETKS